MPLSHAPWSMNWTSPLLSSTFPLSSRYLSLALAWGLHVTTAWSPVWWHFTTTSPSWSHMVNKDGVNKVNNRGLLLSSWRWNVDTDYTVNGEYFVSKIFRAIIFRAKSFSDQWPCTALSLILHMYFHALIIFAQARLSEIFNNEIFAIYGMVLI